MLQAAKVTIGDLPNDVLGLAFGNSVVIDADAAGHGWFIDATPLDDEEFYFVNNHQLRLSDGVGDGIDLLAAVMHEFGHVLGLEDTTLEDLMGDRLPPGVRRVPQAEVVDNAFAVLGGA